MVLLIVILMMSQIVSASSLFFAPFDSNIYTNKLVFSITPQIPRSKFIPQFNLNSFGFIKLSNPEIRNPLKIIPIINLPSIPSTSLVLSKSHIESQEIPSQPSTSQSKVKEQLIPTTHPIRIKTISITEKGFKPQILNVHLGEKVQWINERLHTGSLVYGVRELTGMRSPMLEMGEIFIWTFEREGTFVYVDSVVIGRMGKVIVS